MDTDGRQRIMESTLRKKRAVLRSIYRLQLLAAAVVFATIAVAYARPSTPTTVFISLFPFLLTQVFATRDYVELARLTRRLRLLLHRPYFERQQPKVSWAIPAGVAVRDGYFFLLLVFDTAWLSHAYLYPSPAGSFAQFLRQLAIGPASGTAFLIFTVLLWAFYFYLFVVGSLYSAELNSLESGTGAGLLNESDEEYEVWIRVQTAGDGEIFLQGLRLPNAGQQPLILFPGFYQNGYVYHLSEEASLARYLQQAGFDVWMVHPRGTALSDGRRERSSLDDFAGEDIPAVIRYVHQKTGRQPVFVGHSQGGIAAIISLMGASTSAAQNVALSGDAAGERQQLLKALVVLGSFPDCSFSKASWLKDFVAEGLCIGTGKRKLRLLSSETLLSILKKFAFVGMPFSLPLRLALLQSRRARFALFPLALLLDFISLRKLWEFLYHIPNLSRQNRKRLFYKTMDGSFSGILQQYHSAVAAEAMFSLDGGVDYSAHYGRITLPVSVVAMEFDALADPVMMKGKMFDAIGSDKKFFTLWKGMGHEDHFTDAAYFPQVLDAIKTVC